MSLPSIYNPTPVTVPASQEKSYLDNFMISMQVLPPMANGKQTLICVFRPYNNSTHEMYPSTERDFRFIKEVWEESARSSMFAQVMGGILTLSSLLLQESDLAAKIKATSDASQLATLGAELATVEKTLGVQTK